MTVFVNPRRVLCFPNCSCLSFGVKQGGSFALEGPDGCNLKTLNKGLQLLMGGCYAIQAYRGEIGRIKAAFFLGCFLALPVVAGVMAGQWALHLALPGWSLLLIAGGLLALGQKLADVCYKRLLFPEFSLRGIKKGLLRVGVLLVWFALLAFTLLLSVVSAVRA